MTDTLLNWAFENGLSLAEGVEFRQGHHGIQAYWKGDTITSAKGEKLISLPLKLAITSVTAAESLKFGSLIYGKTSNINSVLKIYLAKERTNKSCFFYPYLNALPSLVETKSPYIWTAQEKEYIKGTNLGNALKENTSKLVEEWWEVINKIPESEPKPETHYINLKFYYEYKFYSDSDLHDYLTHDTNDNWTSFPNYLWASMMLKSRSFPCYLAKEYISSMPEHQIEPDEAMMLPVIDLLSHNPKAKVEWSCSQGKFEFSTDETLHNGSEIFNNYGMKGNEELLLAYGFCLQDNEAESAALKIKVPLELLPQLEASGVKLPKISDYTTSVVAQDIDQPEDYKDGLLFFITTNNVPENLIKLFQCLVRNQFEANEITLRMKFAGLNSLRQAIETKVEQLPNFEVEEGNMTSYNISVYINSQRKVFKGAIKTIKNLEKSMLTDPSIKPRLLSLKSVYKKDEKLQKAILVAFGFASYQDVLDANFQDHLWLLFLIRCYNKYEYCQEEQAFLPEWIHSKFVSLLSSVEISSKEVVQYKDIYLNLIPSLVNRVPEVFGKGKWRVEELIISAKLLDSISFVRGKEQECILVSPE